MARRFTGDLVGSKDILKVFHFPDGFHTVRRSSAYPTEVPFFPFWEITVISPQVSMFDYLVAPQEGLTIELTECNLDKELSTRRFKKMSRTCGRRFPSIVHYFLEEEVTDV